MSIVAWHVRSIRPIREQVNDEDTITRIEFTNGDVLDATDTVTELVDRLHLALAPSQNASTPFTPSRSDERTE